MSDKNCNELLATKASKYNAKGKCTISRDDEDFAHDVWDDSIERDCTVEESLIQSLKEMKLMRESKMPRTTWREFKNETNE